MGFVHPSVIGLGGAVSVCVILQNAYNGWADVRVRLDVQHPTRLGSRLDWERTTKANIGPLGVGLLTIPIRVRRPLVDEGEYQVKVRLQTRVERGAKRIRPWRFEPPSAGGWSRTLLSNALGLAMLGTIGIGIFSIPRSFVGVKFQVAKWAAADEPAAVGEATYRSLWGLEDWYRTQEAKRIVEREEASMLASLSYRALVQAVPSFARKLSLAEGESLNSGEQAMLARAVAAASEFALNNKELARELLVPLVEDDIAAQRTPRVTPSRFIEKYWIQLLAIAAFAGTLFLEELNPTGESEHEGQQLALQATNTLLAGKSPIDLFWGMWGLAGLRALGAHRGDEDPQAVLLDVEEARRSRAEGDPEVFASGRFQSILQALGATATAEETAVLPEADSEDASMTSADDAKARKAYPKPQRLDERWKTRLREKKRRPSP